MQRCYYARKELESMSTKELLDYAKSLSIPADSNWKTEQIISIIEYYQEHNSQNIGWIVYHSVVKHLNLSVAKIVFIIVGIIVGIIHSKSTGSCPTGLCNVADTHTSANDSITDAINSITNEFAAVTKKSTDRVQQRYSDLIDSLQDLERLYTNCQQNMNKIRQENQMVLIGLGDELQKCWDTVSNFEELCA